MEHISDRLPALPGRSLQSSEPRKPPKLWEPCALSIVAERTAVLLGAYREVGAHDPEVFVRAITAVLSEYPEETVRKVTDPARGIPSKLKWPPSIAEIREACEAEVGHIRRNAARLEHETEALRALPSPQRVDDLARERVTKLVERFKADMRGKPDPEAERRAAEAFTDALAARVARGESPLADYPSNPSVAESNRRAMQAHAKDTQK
jgi:hypothetical protein